MQNKRFRFPFEILIVVILIFLAVFGISSISNQPNKQLNSSSNFQHTDNTPLEAEKILITTSPTSEPTITPKTTTVLPTNPPLTTQKQVTQKPVQTQAPTSSPKCAAEDVKRWQDALASYYSAIKSIEAERSQWLVDCKAKAVTDSQIQWNECVKLATTPSEVSTCTSRSVESRDQSIQICEIYASPSAINSSFGKAITKNQELITKANQVLDSCK